MARDDVWGFHNHSAFSDEALRVLQKTKTESPSDAQKKINFSFVDPENNNPAHSAV